MERETYTREEIIEERPLSPSNEERKKWIFTKKGDDEE